MIRRLLNWLFGSKIVVPDNNKAYDLYYTRYDEPNHFASTSSVIPVNKEVCLKYQDLEEELGLCECSQCKEFNDQMRDEMNNEHWYSDDGHAHMDDDNEPN